MDSFNISSHDFINQNSGQLRDNYEVKELIGEGAYGSVRKVTHRLTGENRAIKIISKKTIKNDEDRENILREISVLKNIDHPNILKLHETYEDKFSFFIITELCNGGELFDKITQNRVFAEAIAADYMKQILSCLVYCHDRHIVHRDLKPENFLLDNSSDTANLKLIDFGAANYCLPGQRITKKIGTSYYIAPEVIDDSYTEKCDIWSAGVILYIMLSGSPPFDGKNDVEILNNVKKAKYYFNGKDWDGISSNAKDLVRNLMDANQNTRISAKRALEHPWFSQALRHPLDPIQAGRILGNLKNFHWEKKLQKATLSFIVSQLTTKAEREEMLELFKSLDKDNNGTLSRQEIEEGMAMFVSVTGLKGEVDRIMQQVDIDGSGEIDYTEFITATMNKSMLLSQEKLELAFKMYDVDGSGTITKDELKAILGKQQQYDDSFWEGMIREVDKNGDGVIDIHEFSEMMLSLNQD